MKSSLTELVQTVAVNHQGPIVRKLTIKLVAAFIWFTSIKIDLGCHFGFT